MLDPLVLTSYSSICAEGGGVVDGDDDDDDGVDDDADDDDSGADDDGAADDDTDGMVKRRCAACSSGVGPPGNLFIPSHGRNPRKKSLGDRGCGPALAVVRVSCGRSTRRRLACRAARRGDFRVLAMDTLCVVAASGLGSSHSLR